MRDIIAEQLRIMPAFSDHNHAKELAEMSAILDGIPDAVKIVHQDLCPGDLSQKTGDASSRNGRPGMSADTVLRAVLIKQMTGCSFDRLAFYLGDSETYRAFCRIGITDRPKKSTLSDNIGKLKPKTLESINKLLLGVAKEERIETGRRVRADCTVVESNIHAPTDSSLLWDVVRCLSRVMGKASEIFGVTFANHTKRAKRRNLGILNAKTKKAQKSLYRDLLKVTNKTIGYAKRVAKELPALGKSSSGWLDDLIAEEFAEEMKHFAKLGEKVIDQTERRILENEIVPAKEKIFSIFETHTDIIIKDRRDIFYGHKVCLTTGVSGLVLDIQVLEGNPADSTLAEEVIDRQEDIYGRVPRQAAFDGGFASKANVKEIKDKGVKDVAFNKKRGIDVSEMVKSDWVFRKLTNFRAGIEGGISFLKRCFGLDRCTWKGLEHFKSYVWSSVISSNLLLLARRKMAKAKKKTKEG
jgi:IS5 family transposase